MTLGEAVSREFLPLRSLYAMAGEIAATPPPSETEGSGTSEEGEDGTFRIGTYNILTGQGGGIQSALRAVEAMGIDVGIFQETKLTGGIHPRKGHGYSVFATDAPSKWCGGIALFWRDCLGCAVEEHREWGPNVLSFHLVTGRGRYYCIGAYCPPSDVDNNTVCDIQRAWERCPKGYLPLLMGDLNANIERPLSERDVAVAEQAAAMDVVDMSRQFRQRRRQWVRGRWTWRRKRRTRWISSHPDYILAREATRRRFTNCALRLSNHHDSDHRATVATINGGNSKWLKRYRKRRSRFPLRLPRMGPHTKMDAGFKVLKEKVIVPGPREYKSNDWISKGTWALVDRRAGLRREGKLNQSRARRIGREIKASLQADRVARAARVAEEVCELLAEGNLKEAWRCLRGWYRTAEDRPPTPCYQTLEKQTRERVELYARREAKGEAIPINVDPADVKDDTPSDG